jgi:Uma2 family endonuclease
MVAGSEVRRIGNRVNEVKRISARVDAMATATPTSVSADTSVRPIEGDQCVEMFAIGWEGYKAMLRVRGRESVPRMTYLDGNLWLMSPSFFHESLAERTGAFVIEVAIGVGISYLPAGHTTFRRLKKKGGVEADKSYYFANEARVRGKKRIDLRVDPPPDLVIEAVYTHDAEAAVEVWRRFGVPEVWVVDQTGLCILLLQAGGEYVESEASAIYPFVARAEIYEWVTRSPEMPELEWSRELRQWVVDVLVPRVRGLGG